MNGNPILSADDYRRLKIIAYDDERCPMDRDSLKMLRRKLESAIVRDPEEIPEGVVTVNSRVHLLDRKHDQVTIWTLVFPGEAASERGRLSVLAPLGVAILGRRVGDLIEWPIPSGWASITILKLTYQPEARLRRTALRT